MSTLAKLFIEISAKGADEVQKKLDAQKKALEDQRRMLNSGEYRGLVERAIALEREQIKLAKEQDWAKRVAQVGLFRASLGLALDKAKEVGTAITGWALQAAGAAAALGAPFAVLSRGIEGTREADRLAHAWQFLSRVVAVELSPYIRALTTGLIELGKWFRDLDDGTKSVAAKFIAAGAAVGAVAGAASVVGLALGALLSPIGLVLGGVSLVGAAALGAFGDLSGVFKSLGEWALAAWDAIKSGASTAWTEAAGAGRMFVDFASAAFNHVAGWARSAWTAVATAAQSALDFVAETFGSFGEGVRATFQGIIGWAASVWNAVTGIFDGLIGGSNAAAGAVASMGNSGLDVFEGVGTAAEGSADRINSANRGWLQAAVAAIGHYATKAAEAFNWIAKQFAALSDKIAEWISAVGEKLGALPEGTSRALRDMPAINPIQIDTARVDAFFRDLEGKAGKADRFLSGTVGKFFREGFKGDMLGGLAGVWDKVKEAFNKPKGLELKLNVGFEALQGTFERLQVALTSPPEDTEKAILGGVNQCADALQQLAREGLVLKNPAPAVQ